MTVKAAKDLVDGEWVKVVAQKAHEKKKYYKAQIFDPNDVCKADGSLCKAGDTVFKA